MKRTIQFNTGRLYTKRGQVITATFHDDGVATFCDHSRGINGEITPPWSSTVDPNHHTVIEAFSEGTLRTWLMSHYDAGRYSSFTRSMEDASGVNRERQ